MDASLLELTDSDFFVLAARQVVGFMVMMILLSFIASMLTKALEGSLRSRFHLRWLDEWIANRYLDGKPDKELSDLGAFIKEVEYRIEDVENRIKTLRSEISNRGLLYGETNALSDSINALDKGLIVLRDLVMSFKFLESSFGSFICGRIGKSSLSLPYRQLCGRIAAAVETDWSNLRPGRLVFIFAGDPGLIHEVFLTHSSENSRDDDKSGEEYTEESRRTISRYAEHGLDDLQAHLFRRWSRYRTIGSLVFTLALVLLFATSLSTRTIQNTSHVLLMALATIIGSVLSPAWRAILDRISRPVD